MFVPERSFQLSLSPCDRLEFTGNLMGEIEALLTIKNLTNTRHVYKIRVTSNKLFKITQPIGFIEPNELVRVKIIYQYDGGKIPENNEHHFGIYHIPAPEFSYPLGVWLEHYGEAQGEKRIRAKFSHRDLMASSSMD